MEVKQKSKYLMLNSVINKTLFSMLYASVLIITSRAYR